MRWAAGHQSKRRDQLLCAVSSSLSEREKKKLTDEFRVCPSSRMRSMSKRSRSATAATLSKVDGRTYTQ